jgi:prepilin-type N-terminal cleavage/methylation domain-containing protein
MCKKRITSIVRSQQGFTLLEVMIAVTILAATLTTVYGLQAANARATLYITNQNRAVLLSRQFFAYLQTRPDDLGPLTPQTVQGSLDQIYGAIGLRPPNFSDDERSRFTARLIIDQWPLAQFLPKPIRRLQLQLRWSPTATDQLTTHLFLPPESAKNAS